MKQKYIILKVYEFYKLHYHDFFVIFVKVELSKTQFEKNR